MSPPVLLCTLFIHNVTPSALMYFVFQATMLRPVLQGVQAERLLHLTRNVPLLTSRARGVLPLVVVVVVLTAGRGPSATKRTP